ncbi:MAG: sugar ABC transporter permease [Anaerolineae bacterium]|nr:sugar ABC transporter permease [Anaerolineae bacterium]
MATTSQAASAVNTKRILPPTGRAVVGWHLIVGMAALYGAYQITQLQIEALEKTNYVIQYFAAFVTLIFAVCSLAAALLVFQMKSNGRLISMGVNVIGFALALAYFGQIVGFYDGFDYISGGLARNIPLMLGIPLGYAVVWIAWRLHERSSTRAILEKVGLGIMGISLILLLLAALAAPDADNVVSGLISALLTMLGKWLSFDGIVATVIMVLFAAGCYIMVRGAQTFGETTAQRDTWQGWLFLLPNLLNFSIFFAGPLLLSLYLSFTDFSALSNANFIGVTNYTNMFTLSLNPLPAGETDATTVIPALQTELARFQLGEQTYVIGARDSLFWISIGNTFRYCIFLLPLSIIPALALAVLLNSKMPGMKFYRALFFLPSVAAVVGVALIWKWLYDPVIGYINYALGTVASWFGLAPPESRWLTDSNLLLLSVVIMAAWQVIGFNTVIFLAGLQGVPKELHEAATVDGANGWRRFRSITMPLLAPTTFFIVVTTLISGLQAFTEFFSLVQENPTNAKLTTVYYLYQRGFERFEMGYASATAWALFGLIFIVTLIQFRLSGRADAYSD